MRVPEVGLVGWSSVYARLVDGVGDLVREDASRKARHNFDDLRARWKFQLGRDENQLRNDSHTLCSLAAQRTLSLMRQFSRRNVSLYFIFLKRPPTRAARWITWVGWYFSKMARVSGRDLGARSRSDELTKCGAGASRRYSPQVTVLGAEEDPFLIGGGFTKPASHCLVLDNVLKRTSDET